MCVADAFVSTLCAGKAASEVFAVVQVNKQAPNKREARERKKKKNRKEARQGKHERKRKKNKKRQGEEGERGTTFALCALRFWLGEL